jgi:hypothetical protein
MLMVFCAMTVQAQTIFDSNAAIADGNTYDTVVVKGNGTVVDMTGGSANIIITMDASTFNLSGGTISNQIKSYDSSLLNLSGGNIGKLYCYGTSDVNITGDAAVSSSSDFYQSATLTISSPTASVSDVGFFGGSELNLSDGSGGTITSYTHCKLDISGGSISRLYIAGYWENTSEIDISGGTISDIYIEGVADGTGKVRVSGGAIGKISYLAAGGDYEIDIIGYGLDAIPYGGAFGYGQVNGYWNDDTPLSIDLDDKALYSHVVLYDGVIPPKCVNQLESDLSEDCKVNLLDFSKMALEWLDCGLADANDCW